MGKVTIDPRYWEMVLREYKDWLSAVPRELGQNSIDAGSKLIRVRLENGTLIWDDDGCGMTRDVIQNKLLCLGATGKDFGGTTGGFGVAKSLLLFAQRRYKVLTRSSILEGEGDAYTIRPAGGERRQGARFEIELQRHNRATLQQAIRSWWTRSHTPGVRLFLDGKELLQPDLGLTRLVERDWGTLSKVTNDTFDEAWPGYCVVRSRGQYMFSTFVGDTPAAVCELKSPEALQTNRDGLRYPYYSNLETIIKVYSVDSDAVRRLACADIRLYGMEDKRACGPKPTSSTAEGWTDTELDHILNGGKVECMGRELPFPHAEISVWSNEWPERSAYTVRGLFALNSMLQWAAHREDLGEVAAGVTNDNQVTGVYMCSASNHVIGFNPNEVFGVSLMTGDIIGIICTLAHEVAHITEHGHTSKWGGRMTMLIRSWLRVQDDVRAAWQRGIDEYECWIEELICAKHLMPELQQNR